MKLLSDAPAHPEPHPCPGPHPCHPEPRRRIAAWIALNHQSEIRAGPPVPSLINHPEPRACPEPSRRERPEPAQEYILSLSKDLP